MHATLNKILLDARARANSIPTPPPFHGVCCVWCERIHPSRLSLSVCPTCVARSWSLKSLEMRGAYPLTGAVIDRTVTQTSPGNYALGYMDGDSFSVFYVGRSGFDVKARLRQWVAGPSPFERYASFAKASWAAHDRSRFPVDAPMLGHVGNADTRYTHFAYSYSNSPDAAYAKECRNFDDFGGSRALDNRTGPVLACTG